MSDFDFSSGKRFSRITLARAEVMNQRLTEIATAIATKLDKSGGSVSGNLALTGDLSIIGNFSVSGSFSVGANIDMNGFRVTDAADGVDPQDLVTRAQLTAAAFSPALPSQTGNAGKFVFTNGSTASWKYAELQFVDAPTSTAVTAGNVYNPSGGVTLTLPASPAEKDRIGFAIPSAAETSAVTLTFSGQEFDGSTADLVIRQACTFVLEYFNSKWRLAP